MSKEASKTHYEKNKQVYIQRAVKYRREFAVWYQALKERPCTDCKRQYPFYVMEWDHVRGEKFKSLAQMLPNCNKKAILEEIAKCELVCANCHRERTYIRGLVA